jgi:hypothetical protein
MEKDQNSISMYSFTLVPMEAKQFQSQTMESWRKSSTNPRIEQLSQLMVEEGSFVAYYWIWVINGSGRIP